VINKAVYLAIGVNLDGIKEVLGMWTAETEGAKFWLFVVTELKNRGVKDIFIACVDGLKGFPEAIETVFPDTQVQLCLVHMVRHSLKYVTWRHRKEVATDLKAIYQSSTIEEAENSSQNGILIIRQSVNLGDATGNGLPLCFLIHQIYVKRSIQLTQLNL
jgi:putative transposase